MVFEWTTEQIEWYERAVAWTHFDEFLFQLLSPYLKQEETLCDLGCGIGHVSRCLCRHGFDLTAIDRSENAIRYLTDRAREEGLTGLTAFSADWSELPADASWDTILMCFAGQMQVDAFPFHKRLIVLSNESHQSHIRPEGLPAYDYEAQRTAAAKIDPARYTWHYRHVTTDFGQPFRSLEEAADYLRAYHYDITPKAAKDRLIRTGLSEFPYYLPHQKEIGLYVIERREPANA